MARNTIPLPPERQGHYCRRQLRQERHGCSKVAPIRYLRRLGRPDQGIRYRRDSGHAAPNGGGGFRAGPGYKHAAPDGAGDRTPLETSRKHISLPHGNLYPAGNTPARLQVIGGALSPYPCRRLLAAGRRTRAGVVKSRTGENSKPALLAAVNLWMHCGWIALRRTNKGRPPANPRAFVRAVISFTVWSLGCNTQFVTVGGFFPLPPWGERAG